MPRKAKLIAGAKAGLLPIPGWIGRGCRGVLHLLFPPHCVYCGVGLPEHLELPLLCFRCRQTFHQVDVPFCDGCAMPYSAFVTDQGRCPRCRRQGHAFDRATALGIYTGELRQAVLRMKRLSEEPLVMSMGNLLGRVLSDGFGEQLPDVIVPVPSPWNRRIVRGANNVALVARSVARILRRPLKLNWVKCQRNCEKQAKLPIARRQDNVRGVFRALPRYDIKECHALVIDDVMTTGATSGEVARVLKSAGARIVTVGVIARGIGT